MILHTHTLVSGHAYSTIKENVEAAKLAGLKYIGLSEHAPNMPASPHAYYFQNVHVIPRNWRVRVIQGIEANILDYDGNIDVTPDMVVHMNYMLVVYIHLVLQQELKKKYKCCNQGYGPWKS